MIKITVSSLRTMLSLLCITTLISHVSAFTAGFDNLSDTCKEKLFPVTLGGYGGDDIVTCTLRFEEHNLVLVAGNSTSDDFGPSSEPHAFLSAVDFDGNVKWGQYFTNDSNPVSTISGCYKNSNGSAILLGISNSVPVIIEVNPKTGSVINLVTLDRINKEQDVTSRYTTFGAIYHDL